ncbi:MAG: hypothetical protein DCC57_25435 [Chloroflexi bacterium]|nr:MAG: hypothetical protein DCC57_25435 [Chloroflexota bacterium]
MRKLFAFGLQPNSTASQSPNRPCSNCALTPLSAAPITKMSSAARRSRGLIVRAASSISRRWGAGSRL